MYIYLSFPLFIVSLCSIILSLLLKADIVWHQLCIALDGVLANEEDFIFQIFLVCVIIL